MVAAHMLDKNHYPNENEIIILNMNQLEAETFIDSEQYPNRIDILSGIFTLIVCIYIIYCLCILANELKSSGLGVY